MFLIAGLGNPGRKYARNRHNVGFMVVDRLAAKSAARFRGGWGRPETCELERAGQRLLLVKPQSYMNRSGPPLRRLLERFEVEPTSFLVIVDDVALPLGRIRFRRSGSSGGQKGLQSIIDVLGHREFPRLRIGIDSREVSLKGGLSDYVLSDFIPEEEDVLEEVLERAVEAIDVFLSQGIERAMNLYN